MDVAEILLRRGLITETQVNEVRQTEDVVTWATQNPDLDPDLLMRTIAEELGLDFIDLREESVDLNLLDSFPQKLIYRENLFPVSRQNGSIRIATADPLNFYPLDEIAAATGLTVEPVLADRVEIAKLIKNHLGVGGETVEGLLEQKAEDGIELLEEMYSPAEQFL